MQPPSFRPWEARQASEQEADMTRAPRQQPAVQPTKAKSFDNRAAELFGPEETKGQCGHTDRILSFKSRWG